MSAMYQGQLAALLCGDCGGTPCVEDCPSALAALASAERLAELMDWVTPGCPDCGALADTACRRACPGARSRAKWVGYVRAPNVDPPCGCGWALCGECMRLPVVRAHRWHTSETLR